MNAIERIKLLIISFIIFSSVIIIISGCVDFIKHQNLDNYFSNEDVYDLNDESYLVKKEINICGKKYLPGDVIEKETYDYCKK